MRKRSKHRRGATWLVSAVVAFALVVAHVVGAYAHAAGHNHANGHAACAQQDLAVTAMAVAMSVQDDSERCDEPANDIDACDFMCNGGLAILVTPSFALVDVKSPHSSTVVESVHLRPTAPLERPPKSTVRA